jgi:hypothetical protein
MLRPLPMLEHSNLPALTVSGRAGARFQRFATTALSRSNRRLPLTGYIGYVFGGILAWLAVVAVAAALATSTILMVGLCGAARTRLSWRTIATLGLTIVLFTATSQIRLDAVNYLLASELCGLVFSACGNDPASLQQVASDAALTAGDIASQFIDVFARGWLLASVLVAILALKGLWALAGYARLDEPNWRRAFLLGATVIVCLAVFVDSYNEWRGVDDVFAAVSGIPHWWAKFGEEQPVLRYSLAPLSALTLCGVFALAGILHHRTVRQRARTLS